MQGKIKIEFKLKEEIVSDIRDNNVIYISREAEQTIKGTENHTNQLYAMMVKKYRVKGNIPHYQYEIYRAVRVGIKDMNVMIKYLITGVK